MSLRLFSDDTFVEAKKNVFFPARAITSPEHLVGRTKQLNQIKRAFSNEGKQIFIYGERGVGKTSLAKTAAYVHQSSENEPVLVACSPESSFASIMQDIIRSCLPTHGSIQKTSVTRNNTVGVKGLGHSVIETIESGDVPEISSVNQAIVTLKFIAQKHSNRPVVIVDEFDRISIPEERARFADFLKQISDQTLPIQFIFCGIASDVDGLLGEHFSAGRYIAPIEIGPLPMDALWEIFDKAEAVFGVNIDKEIKVRAALVADGYPYFMHLIGDSLLWNMFETQSDKADAFMFDQSISQAVDEAEPMLRQHYDNATQKYESKDYREVLWSVSAPKVFPKKWREIYDDYYLEMVKNRGEQECLSADSFYKRLLNLTKSSHGEILLTNENGWYKFSENVVRSYVRMRASEAGVNLGPDLPGPLSTNQ